RQHHQGACASLGAGGTCGRAQGVVAYRAERRARFDRGVEALPDCDGRVWRAALARLVFPRNGGSRGLCFLPCEGRGGLGRGAFGISPNRDHPLPASLCLRRGRGQGKSSRLPPLLRKAGKERPALGRPHRDSRQEAAFDFARFSQLSTTVSGLSDSDSMPASISHCARSGWSRGPWPQMPTYLPLARAVLIAIDSNFFTAGSRSSNRWATMLESRSRPSVSWVRSLEPIEKPSKISRNSSASSAFEGTSHIMMIFKPSWPCLRPLPSSTSTTLRPSSRVRTNGIITHRLDSPISLRTLRTALHSSANASAKDGST